MNISQHIGELETQKVFDLGNLTTLNLKIVKDRKEVSFRDILKEISTIFGSMQDVPKSELMGLYALATAPELVDTNDHDTKVRVSAFMLGVLIGKFLGNTKSKIISETTEGGLGLIFDDEDM